MFDVDFFGRLISGLESEGVGYFVYGGLAIEGMRGQITRDHGDVDFVIREDDKPRFVRYMESRGLEGGFSKNGEGERYKWKHPQCNVDALLFGDDENIMRIRGEKADHSIPKDMFLPDFLGWVGKTHFRILPLEFLFSSLVYHDDVGDRDLLLRLRERVDVEKLGRIVTVQKRDQSDPKTHVYEHRKIEHGLVPLLDLPSIRPYDPRGSIKYLGLDVDRVSQIEYVPANTSLLYRHRGVYFTVRPRKDMGDDVAGFRIFHGQAVHSGVLSCFVPAELHMDLNCQVPTDFQAPVLAHEVVEAFYSNKGLGEPEAHVQGLLAEREYAEKFLCPELRASYYAWSREVRK